MMLAARPRKKPKSVGMGCVLTCSLSQNTSEPPPPESGQSNHPEKSALPPPITITTTTPTKRQEAGTKRVGQDVCIGGSKGQTQGGHHMLPHHFFSSLYSSPSFFPFLGNLLVDNAGNFFCLVKCKGGARTIEIGPIRNQNLIFSPLADNFVKIGEGQQKIKIVRTNRQSNLRASCQSLFSLSRHHPSH